MSCEYVVQRAAANLPQSTTQNLFTASGGSVLILGIVGQVTATIQSQATDLTVYVGSDQEVTAIASANMNGRATGLLVGVTSGVTGAVANGIRPGLYDGPAVLANGASVQCQVAQSSTGQIRWTLWYRPLDAGAVVAAV